MNTLSTPTTPQFLNLNNRTFGEYVFVFRINDGYSIKTFSQFKSKHQLLFQKLEHTTQQLNLMCVDSVFPNILADVVLEVLMNGVKSFNQYIRSNRKLKLVDDEDEAEYLTYKFFYFIHLLLYSDIASNNPLTNKTFTDRVYCLKNAVGELGYYSIYDQSKLQLKLLDELSLSIDLNASSITNREARLCLKIAY